jgi:hypothetical protein
VRGDLYARNMKKDDGDKDTEFDEQAEQKLVCENKRCF